MTEIFEPGWRAPQTYWESVKPTTEGLIIFFALFYLPAISCDLLLFVLADKVIGVSLFVTAILFKLIIALVVYHCCYFILKGFITKRIMR